MHPSIRLCATAAAAAALVATPLVASAAATASGTISNISFTLIDLNLTDGIDPWVNWSGEYQYLGATAGGPGDYNGSGLLSDALSVSDSSAGRSAWATTGGDGTGTAGASSAVLGAANADAYATPHAADFELSPWTAIVMNGHFSAQAQTTVGYDGTTSEYARSYGYLIINVWVDNGWESHHAARQAWAGADWDGTQYTGMTGSFDGSYSVNFANLSGSTASGYAQAYVGSQAQGLPPIPEPTTTVLMLAGLASVGFVAARRRREGRPG